MYVRWKLQVFAQAPPEPMSLPPAPSVLQNLVVTTSGSVRLGDNLLGTLAPSLPRLLPRIQDRRPPWILRHIRIRLQKAHAPSLLRPAALPLARLTLGHLRLGAPLTHSCHHPYQPRVISAMNQERAEALAIPTWREVDHISISLKQAYP